MPYYNFIRVHDTLGTTPVAAAGLADRPYGMEWLVERIEAMERVKRVRKPNLAAANKRDSVR